MLKNKLRFTDKERESVRKLADSITPKRWNVCSGYTGHRSEPGILNIHLWLNDFRPEDVERNMRGEKWTSGSQRTVNYHTSYPCGCESVEVEIYLHWMPTLEVIIHELAHVAISRHLSYKHKCCMKLCDFSVQHNHGEEFRRAVKVLERRAKKVIQEGRAS